MSEAAANEAIGRAPPLDLAALIRRHSPGHALEREFYTEPQIFELDMQRVLLRHWFCAGHVSSVSRPGDFLVVDLGSESVIIIRTQQGEIKALLNVCRHRGSRICTARSGRAAAGRLTCPYHAWSYDLDGRLIVAQQMPETFERASRGLKSLAVRVVEGLIFTTFAERPLDFAPAEEALSRTARVHGWAERESRAPNCVFDQGQLEARHRELHGVLPLQAGAPGIREEARLCATGKQGEQLEQAGRRRAEALGIFIEDLDQYACAAQPGRESVSVFRSALYEGVDSATADSRPVARLMGDFTGYDGNSTYFDIGPLSDFLAYADHGVIYRFVPRAVQHTEMEVIWLVHEDAVEGKDYDVDRLTWLWNVTSVEDKKIIELNQEGVNSRFFEPGPYSLQEPYARRFVDWYLRELAPGIPDP